MGRIGQAGRCRAAGAREGAGVAPVEVPGRVRCSPRGAARRGFAAALLLALGVPALAPTGARAGSDVVYRFVDERGVVHLSNIPGDPRYRPVGRLSEQGGIRMPGLQGQASRGTYSRIVRARKPAGPGSGGARELDPLIAGIASRHRISPALVKAVIAAESGFDPAALSEKGAMGLMQLMPDTARELGVRRPFDVVENVGGGVRYLRELLDRFGDLGLALAAYNAGPGAVDRFGGIPPFAETRRYVERVMAYYRRYHEDFGR